MHVSARAALQSGALQRKVREGQACVSHKAKPGVTVLVLGNDVTKLTSSLKLNSPSIAPASPPSSQATTNTPHSSITHSYSHFSQPKQYSHNRKNGSWKRRQHQGLLPGRQRGLCRVCRERGNCQEVEGGQDHSPDRSRCRMEDLHHRVSAAEAITRRWAFADNILGTASKASSTPRATHNWRTSSAPRTRMTSSSRSSRRAKYSHLRYVPIITWVSCGRPLTYTCQNPERQGNTNDSMGARAAH
jgi:hypothetical protein